MDGAGPANQNQAFKQCIIDIRVEELSRFKRFLWKFGLSIVCFDKTTDKILEYRVYGYHTSSNS